MISVLMPFQFSKTLVDLEEETRGVLEVQLDEAQAQGDASTVAMLRENIQASGERLEILVKRVVRCVDALQRCEDERLRGGANSR
jgi:hypothetical protein